MKRWKKWREKARFWQERAQDALTRRDELDKSRDRISKLEQELQKARRVKEPESQAHARGFGEFASTENLLRLQQARADKNEALLEKVENRIKELEKILQDGDPLLLPLEEQARQRMARLKALESDAKKLDGEIGQVVADWRANRDNPIGLDALKKIARQNLLDENKARLNRVKAVLNGSLRLSDIPDEATEVLKLKATIDGLRGVIAATESSHGKMIKTLVESGMGDPDGRDLYAMVHEAGRKIVLYRECLEALLVVDPMQMSHDGVRRCFYCSGVRVGTATDRHTDTCPWKRAKGAL